VAQWSGAIILERRSAFKRSRALDKIARPPYGGREAMTDRLRDLRSRLTRLHKTLLDEERHTYEAAYGPVSSSPALLQLLLHHEHFAWLRALSSMITAIDAALDEPEDIADVQIEAFFGRTRALLRSGGDGPFETKYRQALQRSPDVVMAHAAVVKALPAAHSPTPEG
jgi:hypothetical protein